MVLIDMEMPKSCSECPFVRRPELVSAKERGLYEYISCCNKAPDEIDDPWRSIIWQSKNRETWCPLKPVTPPEPQITTNIYDTEEIRHGCTVQVLRNSETGDMSVGWWKEKEEEK